MWREKTARYLVLLCLIFLAGCGGCGSMHPAILLEAPARVRSLALADAANYLGVDYVWGGWDWHGPRHVAGVGGVDCSGLVINTYRYATSCLGFSLPFSDGTVAELHDKYTVAISRPEPGDLIFMGEGEITHLALFERIEKREVYFIDAFSTDGVVKERHYAEDNPKLIEYGRLLVLSGLD